MPDEQRVRDEVLPRVEPAPRDVVLLREELEPDVGLQPVAPVRHALPVLAGLAAADAPAAVERGEPAVAGGPAAAWCGWAADAPVVALDAALPARGY